MVDKARLRWVVIVTYPIPLVSWLVELVDSFVAWIVPLAVAASRMFFLVEAFISLRAPEPGIYETVQWTQFWPYG